MTAATSEQALPRWDLTPIFPGLDSREFAEEFAAVAEGVGGLAALFEERGIGAERGPSDPQAFDEVTERLNAMLERFRTVYAYLTACISTDSRDEAAQARMSELRRHQVEVAKLRTRYIAWVGSLDADSLVARSQVARDHEFMVRRAAEAARHLMTPPEEDLAAELEPSGGTAWVKLHSDVTSQLVVDVEVEGTTRQLPMSEVSLLAYDPERAVRRAAYEAELDAWERTAVPLAAALNSVKGATNVLCERRGWASPLDE